MAAAALGISWLLFLYTLTSGQGLVSIDLGYVILNWIAVLVLSCGTFILSLQIGWLTLLGWAGGQFAFLTYDGMGRSLQLFRPTNFFEAVLYAIAIVIGFNWPVVLGAIGGFLVKRELSRK